MNFYIIVDITNMAYGAWYGLGKAALTNHGAATGCIYGTCRSLQALANKMETANVVACFDAGTTYRSTLYPGYKADREEKRAKATEEEKQARAELLEQLGRLPGLLAAAGVQVVRQPGYEADDLLAAMAAQVQGPDKAMVVSSDEDLWQVLRAGTVWVQTPRGQRMTEDKFRETFFGLGPERWPAIKAWAGCSTDNIPGLDGIGEKRAAQYLAGLLKSPSKAAEKFTAPGAFEMFERNIKLTRLPAPGTVAPALAPAARALDWRPVWEAIGAQQEMRRGQTETGNRYGFGLGVRGPITARAEAEG